MTVVHLIVGIIITSVILIITATAKWESGWRIYSQGRGYYDSGKFYLNEHGRFPGKPKFAWFPKYRKYLNCDGKVKYGLFFHDWYWEYKDSEKGD